MLSETGMFFFTYSLFCLFQCKKKLYKKRELGEMYINNFIRQILQKNVQNNVKLKKSFTYS